MLVHNVYFWLKEGVSEADRLAFETGLRTLCGEPNIHRAYFGKPVATSDRDVTDHSFVDSLVVFFADMDSHNRYQEESAIHDKFVADHNAIWSRVSVYDAEVL